MEQCVRDSQASLRKAGTMKRAKSVFQQRNLGTILSAKKDKKKATEPTSSGNADIILRILRMRYVRFLSRRANVSSLIPSCLAAAEERPFKSSSQSRLLSRMSSSSKLPRPLPDLNPSSGRPTAARLCAAAVAATTALAFRPCRPCPQSRLWPTARRAASSCAMVKPNPAVGLLSPALLSARSSSLVAPSAVKSRRLGRPCCTHRTHTLLSRHTPFTSAPLVPQTPYPRKSSHAAYMTLRSVPRPCALTLVCLGAQVHEGGRLTQARADAVENCQSEVHEMRLLWDDPELYKGVRERCFREGVGW
jgi:hypothetical protein